MRRLLVVAPLLMLLAAAPAAANERRAKPLPRSGDVVTRAAPVVFVHGADLEPFSGPAGWNCKGLWGARKPRDGMIGRFARFGHRGPFPTVAYYDHDADCSRDVGRAGKHRRHFATLEGVRGHTADGGHTRDTSIRHLGYHLAWSIARLNERRRSNVVVVAHSMGGLMLRYAIYQAAAGHRHFPPLVMVKDAITFGTPHLGSGLARACTNIQCREMRPGSGLLAELEQHGQNPQGYAGTDWTLIGAHDDEVVAPGSAVGMAAAHKVLYYSRQGVEHPRYPRLTRLRRDARVEYADADGRWWDFHRAPWPVRWADFAAATPAW